MTDVIDMHSRKPVDPEDRRFNRDLEGEETISIQVVVHSGEPQAARRGSWILTFLTWVAVSFTITIVVFYATLSILSAYLGD